MAKLKVLIEFRHGLGDAAQFTAVLRHLRELRKDWLVDMASLRGKHSAFFGLCENSWVLDDPRRPTESSYQHVFKIGWHECRKSYSNSPATKTALCLREVFDIEPEERLLQYHINVGQEAGAAVDKYLAEIGVQRLPGGRAPIVLLHYQGNTSKAKKDIEHATASRICKAVIDAGRTPIILDWDRRSAIPDQKTIFCPCEGNPLWGGGGSGDAERLAALIQAAELMVGIDSGPLHVAGATHTPTIALWTKHHPIHYFDLSPTTLHLIPTADGQMSPGPESDRYFAKHYRHQFYTAVDVDMPATVSSTLTGESFEVCRNKGFLMQLRSKSYNKDYYEEHRVAGLDYLSYGGWHQNYGRWFVDSLNLKGKTVLDVGAACGALMRGIGWAGAVVQGVEINEHMVRISRETYPDMAKLIHVCDAVNLHIFGDCVWDAIHTAQVGEHWKPELVPHILQEFHRVCKPGALFWCALDTTEMFERQGRKVENEDPTHVCVKPQAWWEEKLAANGWEDVSAQEPGLALLNHHSRFIQNYDWGWFLARRK